MAVPTVISDNCANVYICSDKNMYKTFRPASASKVVAKYYWWPNQRPRWNWNRQRRVKSEMISTWLDNTFNEAALSTITLQNELYCGLKQASANWYNMLSKALKIQGFTPSKVDPCVFINDGKANDCKGLDARGASSMSCKSRNAQGNPGTSELGLRIQGKAIILVYVDNCIVIRDEKGYAHSFITSLTNCPENFEFAKEGSHESYL